MIARQRTALAAILAIFTLLSACASGNSPGLEDNSPVVPSDFGFRLCEHPDENRFGNCSRRALRSDILTPTATSISTRGFTQFDVDPTICTQRGCLDESQAVANQFNDGYAYFIGLDSDTRYSYSGILPTTNVGRPLPVFTAPVATWVGEWSLNEAVADANNDADNFELRINYATRQFSGTGVKIIDGVAHRLNVGGFYTATGTFDIDPRRSAQADLLRGGLVYQGVLVGLIGQERGVGAFHSSDPRIGFAGGFVVNPPTR